MSRDAYASEPEDVSLIQLIANPTHYQGKTVRVIGFCRLEFEGNALYLHREDFERGIHKNGLWLGFGWPVPEKYRGISDEYVLIEGVFNAGAKGHLDLFSGELKDIGRAQRWPSRVERERADRLAPAK